ncbi:PTS system, cellobiose-specific IIC component [Spiroplasma litorale]|uniref:PTS system, cellobiose-specific IIC component n=1 Tax=Spiroplasma litorale TaxID=216942 RepID=A0A0K1W1N0_9MOLU|nr:PTS transporter subunit EIIC [Spiroplasma litorale]AKX34229.1 PTS system, cellobiose-specific IIC component [Spiroplasma litorale]
MGKKTREVNPEEKGVKYWFNEKLMPAMTKLASQKHLTAIRDAFGILTPIIIGGSISFLLGILIFGAGGNLETSLLGLLAKATNNVTVVINETTLAESWQLNGSWAVANEIGEKIFQTIFDYSMGTFSLMAAVMLGFIYAEKRGLKEPMFVAVFNLVLFLITAATFASSGKYFNYFYDSKGMLAAIIQTFLVIELYRFFANNKKLLIKMPKSVPPMVATGFSLLVPVALTLIIVSTINTGAWSIGKYTNWDINSTSGNLVLEGGAYGIVGLFYKAVSAPFMAIISGNNVGLGFGMLYQFLVGFFWFFGLNGSSVVNGAFYPFLLQMFVQNAQAVSEFGYNAANASNALGVVNIQFIESYSQTTGWGHTGALLIAIAIFGRVREQKDVAKLAAVPAVFSINEPVTFGIPIMLHPVYGIAAMIAMPLTTFVAWIFVGPLGWVNKSYIMVPWTLPPGIGALLSTGLDWRALLLSWFCLAIAFVWYIPFVLIANKYHYNLNLKAYIDQGMTKKEAIAAVANDNKIAKEQAIEKKELRKKLRLDNKQEKLRIKNLPNDERIKVIHEQRMFKKEQASILKLEENIKIISKADKTITVDVVEYGGYKIRINGKTVATALNDEKMKSMVIKIAKANNVSEYKIMDKGKEIEKIKIEE